MQEPTAPSLVARIRTFVTVWILCCLFTFALIRLDFESGSPLRFVLPVVCGIFALTYWLPKRCVYYVMAIGSLISGYFFLGIYNTAALAIIILSYVALFYVFRKTWIRITLGILMTLVLAVLRMGVFQLPVLPLAAPIAGSMIMFRFALMVYEHHYGKPESTWIQKFSYLLLPPALAFPLFPIIDYKAFLNNHRPQDSQVLRTGLSRIAAGLVFMMIYRICYLYFIPGYAEVIGPLTAFTYTIGNYLYVLNVLGVLWVSVGYLGILGFDLPQVFNYIFLIDSFRDVWRRINVYWRDFVVKLIYYPVYFKLRKRTKAAILITSLVTLGTSAVLHGWQWFWIQGSVTLQAPGVIFWCILGLVISINLSLQRGEPPKPQATTSRSIFFRSLRISGMILFMSFMWSLWNSSSVSEWLNLLHYYAQGSAFQYLIILGCIAVLPFIAWLFLKLPEKPPGYHFLNRPLNSVLILAIGVLLTLPTFQFFRSSVKGKTGDFITMISTAQLNMADESSATENYYNRMLASDGLGSRPWEMHTPGGEAKSGLDDACIRRDDILVRELIPNKVTVLDGWSIATNSFGMRDKEYLQKKPEGVYRIAILGASYEMGSGVPQDSVFEAVMENILADSFGLNKIEVLNFSVGGYHLPQQVWVAENKLPAFEPDLILCFVHPSDATRNSNYMASLVKNGTNLIYPELYAIKKEAGAEQFMEERVLVNRLYPFSHRIASWSLSRISIAASEMHAQFGVVYIPTLTESSDAEFYRELYKQRSSAEQANEHLWFFDLADIFNGHEAEYKLEKDPTHPNSKAHRLIATELVKKLVPAIRISPQAPR